MTNHENDPRQKIQLSPEALLVVEGVATAMATLQKQLDLIPTLTESQLPEVYAGLRVLRARWAMPPYSQAYDDETVPGVLKEVARVVETRHSREYLRANGALSVIGGPEHDQAEQLVAEARDSRDTLAQSYARQELRADEIASTDPIHRGVIRAVLGE